MPPVGGGAARSVGAAAAAAAAAATRASRAGAWTAAGSLRGWMPACCCAHGKLSAALCWLLLLACCASAQAQGAPAPAPQPDTTVQTVPLVSGNRTQLNVCSAYYTPFVFCEPGQTEGFGGYDIALFNDLRLSLGWKESMLNWSCWKSFGDLLPALKNGTCDIIVAGVTISGERIEEEAYHFTWPTYTGGLSIAVPVGESAPDIWAFLRPFSWDVWVVTLLTCFFAGLIIWLLDLWAIVGEEGEEIDQAEKLKIYLYTTMGRPMGARDAECDSFGGNIVMITLCFILMVVVAIYTANTAAIITTFQLNSEIKGMEDLPGRVVGTWEGYVPLLGKKGIKAIGFPWDETEQAEMDMFYALTNGTIEALVLDTATVEYISYPLCNVTMVGEEWAKNHQAFTFSKAFADENEALMNQIDTTLMTMQAQGVLEVLEDRIIKPSQPECIGYSGTSQIGMDDLAGLWIVFSAALALAVLCGAFHHFVIRNSRLRGILLRLRSRKRHWNRRLDRRMRASRRDESFVSQIVAQHNLHLAKSGELEGAPSGKASPASEHAVSLYMGDGAAAAAAAAAADADELQAVVHELGRLQSVVARLAAERDGLRRSLQHHRPQRSTSCAVAAAAADVAPPSPEETRSNAVRLAVETLRPDWPLLAFTCLALVATIAFTLAFPLAIGEVFDVVRAQGGLADAPAAAVANPFSGLGAASSAPGSFRAALAKLAACLVLSASGNALVSYCSTLLGERFAHRLKGQLMETIVARPQSFFDSTPKGDLVARLTLDVQVLQATLADFIGQRGFRSMFEVTGALLLIAVQQPLLALVSLAITPLLSRLLRSVVVRSSAIIYRRQQVAAEALEYASERLSQVQTVQVFAAEGREAGAFEALDGSGYSMARRYAFFQGIVEGAGRLAVNVGTVALLGFGGLLVIQGRISVGALLAVNVFNLFISVGLSSVAASLGELGKAVGALERVAELVAPGSHGSSSSGSGGSSSSGAAASEVAAAAAAPASSSSDGSPSHAGGSTNGAAAPAAPAAPVASASGRVDFEDVWFQYPGASDWAVRGLNLTLLPGQTLALVGPSGGGKSTIAALLLGLYQPQRGRILVDGQPLPPAADGGSAAVHVGMAAVLQQPMLMAGTVAQQIRYGKPGATEEEVLAAARAAHADEFVQQLPQGYATEVGERGHALSGGQKQRLSIARALLLQPKILVLDEVTSALDVTSERYISDTLRSLAATKLIIAHRLSTVRRADVIAVVEGGRIVEAGTRAELLQLEGGIYRRLVDTADMAWVASGISTDGSSSSDDEGGKAGAAAGEPAAAASA